MGDTQEAPVFDFVAPADYLEERDTIVHKNPDGEIAYWHSPLGHGTIRCTICESGARVYL
jgi:hypothetical protein